MNAINDSTRELGVVTKIATSHFLYQVNLADNSRVYMRLLNINYHRDNQFVVIVDAERFLQLWRNADYLPHRGIAHGNPESWQRDYKFNVARKGFAKGIVNPVPLADVSCFLDTRKSLLGRTKQEWCVGITNGITRTIYLLVHGANSFPVMCRGQEEALYMHEQAGFSDQLPKSLDQLIPQKLSETSYLLNNGFIDPLTHKVRSGR